uniref:BTB domain-containing protein n=1 Tax=Strigamia maritima TaxID=126957 RepID=T1JE90_STRMM
MPLCAIPGCLQKGNYNFPRDHNLWLKWRKAIIRATYPRVSNSWHPRYVDVICSRHFKPEELTPFLERTLVDGAVPSIFNKNDNLENLKVKISDTNTEAKLEVEISPKEAELGVEISPKEAELEVEISPKEGELEVEISPKEGDLEVEISPKEGDLKVEISPKEGDLEVDKSPKESDLEVEIIPKETDNSSLNLNSKKDVMIHHIAKGSSRRVTIFQGENHAPNMCKALNDLRVRGVCCDVSIIVPNSAVKNSEGIKFKAHSVVLAARSAFFKTFFMKPGNYTQQTIVMPTYINGRAVEIVLHYMYTGKLGIRKDTVSTIFQVGWLFQMDDILMLCKQFCKMKKYTPNPVEVNEANYAKSETTVESLEKEPENIESENNQDLEVLTPDIKEDTNEITSEMTKNTPKLAKTAPKLAKIAPKLAKIAPKLTQIVSETLKLVEISPEIPKISQIEAQITPETSKTDTQLNEMSVIMKDSNCNDLQLVEGPPEMIECTPTILADNDEEEESNFTGNQSPKERKLIIFKTGTSQTQTNEGGSKASNENGFGNADLIVVHFRNNLSYPSPVLYVVHGMRNYTDLLVQHGFFHIEFHVDNNCRKGVVKTDGSLICAMFGQVNHFFPLYHSVTPEDVGTYRYEENKPLTFSTKRIVPIKRPTEMTDEWDPIFGRDRDCEKDVLHCFSCSCVFFTIQGKASHLLRHHRDILHWDTELNVYKYPCGSCEFMCTNLRLLYFHRHQKHDWQLPEVVLQFRCGLCCACETSIHTARDHMVKVHNFAQFSHSLANAAAGKKVFLHLVTKEGLKRQEIPPDPIVVNDSSVLQSEVEVAEKKVKEKVFRCPDCDYSSAYNGNLKYHIKSKHSGPGKSPKKKRRRRRKNVY